MRIFTLSLAAAICAGMYAQPSLPIKSLKHPDMKQILQRSESTIFKTPAQSRGEDDDIIWEDPEGTLTVMSRSCKSFTVEGYEAIIEDVIGSVVKYVTTEDGEVYLGNPFSTYPVESWIKATKDGNTLTIEGIQPIYMEYDYDTDEEYRVCAVPLDVVVDEYGEGTCVVAEDLSYKLTLNENGVYENNDRNKVLGVCIQYYDQDTYEYYYYWTGYGDRQIQMAPVTSELVSLPEDMPTEDWVWKDQYVSGFVEVAISGDEIYVSGMDRSLPEAWVKGTIADGKAIFPSGQYFGPDYTIGYLSYFFGASFHYEENPFTGEDELHASLEDAAIFDYDAENKMLSAVNGYVINSSATETYPLYAYDQVTVGKQYRNELAAPAAPYDLFYEENTYYDERKVWVQIPNVDVEGNMLNENRLYYQILVDGEPIVFDPEVYITLEEPTTMLPYNYNSYDVYVEGTDHTVYLYCDPGTVIGVRSAYINENGDTIYSDTVTTQTSSIASVVSGKEIVDDTWYDMQGRQISRPASGIAIRGITYSDGTVSHKKVVIK